MDVWWHLECLVNLKCNQSQLNKTIPFYCPMTHTPFTFPQSHPISSTPISLSFILLMYHPSTQSLSSLSFQSFFFSCHAVSWLLACQSITTAILLLTLLLSHSPCLLSLYLAYYQSLLFSSLDTLLQWFTSFFTLHLLLSQSIIWHQEMQKHFIHVFANRHTYSIA